MSKIILVAITFLTLSANAFEADCKSKDGEFTALVSADVNIGEIGKANLTLTGPNNWEMHDVNDNNDDVLSTYDSEDSTLSFEIAYDPDSSHRVVFKNNNFSKANLVKVTFTSTGKEKTKIVAKLVCSLLEL